jgi:hypothetical protein
MVRPASVRRDWMNRSPDHFAYRCLPLVIANTHGWELLLDQSFSATWTGGSSSAALTLSFPLDAERSSLPASHFGQGVLTFQVGYLFQTEELYNLWVTGPINSVKDGIAPLTGVVETDWAPYTFTMNWIFTRPGTVQFEKGEPFCHFFPTPRHLLAAVEPEVRELEETSRKSQDFTAWLASREAAVERYRSGQSPDGPWSMRYFKGEGPDGEVLAKGHESRLRVRPFVDHSSRRSSSASD